MKSYLDYYNEFKEAVSEFLFSLVSIRSYSNEEIAACDYAFKKFSEIPGLKAEKIMMDNDFKKHKYWCYGFAEELDYTGHYNIELTWPGTGKEKPFFMNAHIDTVPEMAPNLLPPHVTDGILYGLGACDDKGSVATIYAVFMLLSKYQVELPFDVVGHIVVEEEIGGNGAAAITDRPLEGQAAIDLEPTTGCIYPATRGGLILRVDIRTKSGLMGLGQTENAFTLSRKAMKALEREHSKYADSALNVKYYEGYRCPMPIGSFYAGDDYDASPDVAMFTVLMTYLDGMTGKEMRMLAERAIKSVPELKDTTTFIYTYERDPSTLDFNHPFVLSLQKAAQANGISGDIVPMFSLGDKFFYQEVLGMPTVVFGPGSLTHAHNKDEQVKYADVMSCAKTIFDWILEHAGKEGIL